MIQAMKKSQALINPETTRSILEKMGYDLLDCGNHWRTKAIYRGGDNPTAVQIYKDTGVWTDYIHGNGKSKPLKALINLTVKNDPTQCKELEEALEKEDTVEYTPVELIEMQKIYPNEWLDKLFPNYSFYKNRNISEETQKFFKTGLASGGQLYRRMVFPIYNEHSQIIGFSGRRVDENHSIKWKHIGRKTSWLYPSYIPAEVTVDQIIDKQKEVYLLESIGDAMALHEQGIKNVLVIFGTNVSPAVISYLCGKDLNKVYICTNNDFNSSQNNGLLGAFKAYVKLSGYFNLDQLEIKLPPKPYNDFGKAHEDGCSFTDWKSRLIDTEKQQEHIFSYVKNHITMFPKEQANKFLKLNEQ